MWNIFWLTVALLARTHAVSRPPGIFLEPPYDIYYKAGETVELPCKADGEPKPSYEWHRNEIAFNPSGNDDRIVQLPDSGTLVINMPEDKDEGIFQCFAKNDFGRSASKKVNLRQAKLASFAIERATTLRPMLGKDVTLNCVPPESVPPPSVFWVTKTSAGGFLPVNYDSRVSMDREYRLRITNVKASDANNNLPYACMVINIIMRSNSQGPLFYIQPEGVTEDLVPVKYLWSDQDSRFGLRGSNMSVKCIFAGNPTPDVHWERTDNKSMSDRVNTRSFAQELQITNLQFEDAGNYECWATNSVSQQREYRTFTITVNASPYFVRKPKDVVVAIGEKAELACNPRGVPKPWIEWSVNGVLLKDVVDPRINGPRFEQPADNIVTLENVELTDRMVFQCNASNVHGYVFANLRLDVRAEPPTIVTPPKPETEAAEGQVVILTCETTGMPVPLITWYKDELPVAGQRFTILPTGSLLIKPVVLEDAGHYRCQGQNRYNTTEASGQLIVRHKTRIVQFPTDLEVVFGSPATFNCTATTDPEKISSLRILWKRTFPLNPGYEIPLTDDTIHMTLDIYINSVFIVEATTWDSGTYTCVATNGIDNVTASATLKVKDVPEPPHDVRWTSCGWSAGIAWTPGEEFFSPTEKYVLQYNTSFNPSHWTTHLEVNATFNEANLTLNPYVNYTFRVIAHSQIGNSYPSDYTPTVCTTKPDRPRTQPQNLRTLGHKYGKLYIEWKPVLPILQSGPGFYYLLNILPVGAEESLLISLPIDDWSTDHYELSTSNNYRPFRISIRAINAVGEAAQDPPTIIGYSYEAAPVITPTNFTVEEVNDTYVVFLWEFDKSKIGKENSKIRGEFKGFRINIWEENERLLIIRQLDIAIDSLFNGTRDTFTSKVDTLTPNKRMQAQIAVMNNNYNGAYSESVSFTTLPGLPASVEYIRVVDVGETEVNLEWAKPFENTGVVEGYDITYRLVNGLQLGELKDRDPLINDSTATNASLSDLMPSSKYRVSIYARSAKGRGEEYFIEFVTDDPPKRPDPPLNVWTHCNVMASVTWQAGNDNKAPILYYDLQYNMNTSLNPNNWTLGLRVNASLRMVNFTLYPDVNYTFRLIAYNKVGSSDPSEPTSKICTNRAKVPSAQPQRLRTLGNKHGKLYIKWDPVSLSLQNGPGFYYSLQIQRLHGQQETDMLMKVEDWSRNSFEMAVEYCYEPYRITIRSVNMVGEAIAEPPSIIGYSYEDTPTIAPINFTVEEAGDAYVIFIWNFDKSEIGKYQTRIRGEFKGFKVLFWEQDKQGNVTLEQDIRHEELINLTGNTFSARVDSLAANTTMEARIAVVNNYFTGIPSQPVKFSTQPKCKSLAECIIFTTQPNYEPLAIKTACQNLTEALEHQRVTLVCEVTGNPRPAVTWYKNNLQVQGGRHNIFSNGTLTITSVMLGDSGVYTCKAGNQFSSITAAKCTLTVQGETGLSSGNVLKFTNFILTMLFLLYKAVGETGAKPP